MTFWRRSASATSFSVGRAVIRARMASSVDMCAGVCAARCESSARGSIVGGRRAAATAARGTDGRRSPTLHLALGLLGPLLHGLDFLLVRDDLVVVFRMTLAKLLELRFPLVKHLLALLQQPARLGELRLEVRDLLLGRGRARLKILDLALGRGRAGLGGDNYSIFAVGVASGKSPDVSTGVSPTRPEGGVTGRRV